MKKKLLVVLIISFSALNLWARSGHDQGGGGDLCENRIKTIKDDFVQWIGQGGSEALTLPKSLSVEDYGSAMLVQLATAKVRCVAEGDAGYPVQVDGTAKTCRFDKTPTQAMITCDLKKFEAVPESDQYVLVHHEYAGLAGIEKPVGDASTYEISNQISEYLEERTVKKLAVKPTVNYKDLCKNKPETVALLEYIFGKTCGQITKSDFLTINAVSLYNVEIKRLPANIFYAMPNLKYVTFHWVAGLYELPPDLFTNNPQLEGFYMSTSGSGGGDTMADELPTRFLQNKSKLTSVKFLNTRIKAIPAEAFSGAKNLTKLDLAWNRISSVGAFVCRGCDSLTEISFLNGLITHVSLDAFRDIPNLKTVDLRQNFISAAEQAALAAAYPKVNFDFKNQR